MSNPAVLPDDIDPVKSHWVHLALGSGDAHPHRHTGTSGPTPEGPGFNPLSHRRFLPLPAQSKFLLLKRPKVSHGKQFPLPQILEIRLRGARPRNSHASSHLPFLNPSHVLRTQTTFPPMTSSESRSCALRQSRPPLVMLSKHTTKSNKCYLKPNDSSLYICLMTHPLYLSNELRETFKKRWMTSFLELIQSTPSP